MASPVSTDALNLSASSTAFAADSTRNAANDAAEMRFSDLLLGRIQHGAGLRATETPPVAMANSARTLRDSTRSPTPASADRARHPTREREPERAAGRDKHPASTQRAEQKAPESSAPQPQTNAEPPPSGQTGPTDLPDDAAQTQTAEAAPSNPAATIAALLSGIAAETGKDAASDEPLPEAAGQNPFEGRARHPATNNPAAQTTGIPQDAAKSEAEAGSDAATEDGGTPAHKAFIQEQDSGRTRQPVTIDKPGTLTQSNIAAAINAAAVQAPRADGGGRNAQAGVSASNAIPFMPDAPRTAASTQANTLQFTVPPGAGQRAWAEEIGNRVMWMLGRAESRAELILTPPHLGKVEVSIQLNGDQSTAQFLASTQAAREALEQAMPRLRELLAQAGISLGEASVNTSAEGRANGEESAHRAGQHASGDHDDASKHDDVAFIPSASRIIMNEGLVDTFA